MLRYSCGVVNFFKVVNPVVVALKVVAACSSTKDAVQLVCRLCYSMIYIHLLRACG